MHTNVNTASSMSNENIRKIWAANNHWTASPS